MTDTVRVAPHHSMLSWLHVRGHGLGLGLDRASARLPLEATGNKITITAAIQSLAKAMRRL